MLQELVFQMIKLNIIMQLGIWSLGVVQLDSTSPYAGPEHTLL